MKISKLAITIQAEAAIAANRFVSFANVPAGQGEAVLGVAAFDADKDADLTVDVLGVFYMPASGPIARGALVGSDANALPVEVENPALAFGRALTAAANPGDTIKILAR